MFFCHALTAMIEHHHSAEEEHFFPDISVLTGNSALMAVNLDQHKLFHDGLHGFDDYIKATEEQPDKYR